MLKLACVLVLAIVGQGLGDCVTDGTTLEMAFLTHRHGDRTPTSSTVAMSTNVEAVETVSAKFGYGQLTEVGKRHAYELGTFIRYRYDSLLSPQYNRSEIYLRSTDSTRAKMTLLTALAAIFRKYPGSWSKEVNWVPVPYTTVPAKYDFNLATLNCPNFITAQYANMMSATSRMDPYTEMLAAVAEACNVPYLTAAPVALAYATYDVLKSQQSLGVDLGNVSKYMPELKEAAGVAIDTIFGTEGRLNSGVMLNEFITYGEELIAGTDTPRVRIYSAHDINVFGFEAAAMVTPRQGVPPYASSLVMEIRKVVATGQYVVVPVYLPSPGEDPIYLSIEGCDSPCDFDTYKDIVSSNILDEDTWRTECGFTEDLTVDDSNIA